MPRETESGAKMSNSAVTNTNQLELDIHPEGGTLGAEIRGLQLKDIDDATFDAIRHALAEHSVLFFPSQFMSVSELKTFGLRWGSLVVPDIESNLGSEEDSDVFELRASAGAIADVWHTDLTPLHSPPFGSILSMKKLPASGGDTMWSSQSAAYETLSAPIRDLIDNLTAIHEYPKIPERSNHPMVIVHPVTGRKCLFVSPLYTKRIPQLSAEESDTLLNLLFEHSVQPHLSVRRRWAEGDIAIWENLYTQHFVVNDFTGERIIQRVTIEGDAVPKMKSTYPDYEPTSMSVGMMSKMINPVED